ncbi:MAG: hypothetical protein NVSMB51_12010 [Solirubrobacteraceae bacterium]
MSTPPRPPLPPELPTQQVAAEGPRPIVGEPVVAAEPGLVLARLESLVDGLRTALFIVGVIAVAALGVALYTLLRDDNNRQNGSRNGLATDARVSRVNARIDRLNAQVSGLRTAPAASGAAASGNDTAALNARVDALDRTVKGLSTRPAGSDPTQALSQLSTRLDALSRDVAQLKQNQAAQSQPQSSTP